MAKSRDGDLGNPHGASGPGWSIVSHRSGPWLLFVGQRCFSVSPALGRQIARFAGETPRRWPAFATIDEADTVRGLLAGGGCAARTRGRHRFIWLRTPLLPGRLVDATARLLCPLASSTGLSVQLVVGAAGYGFGAAAGSCQCDVLRAGASFWIAAILLLLCTAIWHELGHATALRHEGYPSGGVGAGMLFVIPVFFCDVTPVVALPRRGRLRVDLAGIAFQVGAGGFCYGLGACTEANALCWAGLSALLAVGWSALPFVRTDGYWLLCDLLGRSDLDLPVRDDRSLDDTQSTPSQARERVLAAFLLLYRLANIGFVVLVCVYLPWALASRLSVAGVIGGGECGSSLLRRIVTWSSWLLAAWIWWQAGRRVVRLFRACRLDFGTAVGSRRSRR